jgi:Cof subfamily protein (haloacid dehalogenase superfamily)
MEKKPKLVASDIGGTLVHQGDILPRYTARVLNRLLSLKIPVALVTGYNFNTARNFAQNLNRNVILIVQNGALAFQDSSVIWEQSIAEQDAREIFHFMEKKDMPIYVYKGKSQNFKAYCQNRGESQIPAKYLDMGQMVDLKNSIGISTRIPNDILEKTRTDIQNLIGSRFQVIISRGIQLSWLEITPAESRKDLALKKLCQLKSIPISEVIYFGDNTNDLEALKTVGFPVVVDNASPELKENVDTIIKSSCEQGVARYLNNLFKLQEKPLLDI